MLKNFDNAVFTISELRRLIEDIPETCVWLKNLRPSLFEKTYKIGDRFKHTKRNEEYILCGRNRDCVLDGLSKGKNSIIFVCITDGSIYGREQYDDDYDHITLDTFNRLVCGNSECFTLIEK